MTVPNFWRFSAQKNREIDGVVVRWAACERRALEEFRARMHRLADESARRIRAELGR
jgi:hypothetical protein